MAPVKENVVGAYLTTVAEDKFISFEKSPAYRTLIGQIQLKAEGAPISGLSVAIAGAVREVLGIAEIKDPHDLAETMDIVIGAVEQAEQIAGYADPNLVFGLLLEKREEALKAMQGTVTPGSNEAHAESTTNLKSIILSGIDNAMDICKNGNDPIYKGQDKPLSFHLDRLRTAIEQDDIATIQQYGQGEGSWFPYSNIVELCMKYIKTPKP